MAGLDVDLANIGCEKLQTAMVLSDQGNQLAMALGGGAVVCGGGDDDDGMGCGVAHPSCPLPIDGLVHDVLGFGMVAGFGVLHQLQPVDFRCFKAACGLFVVVK
jgi:hypothetical protein